MCTMAESKLCYVTEHVKRNVCLLQTFLENAFGLITTPAPFISAPGLTAADESE